MLGVFPLCYYLVYTEDTIDLQKDSNFAKKKINIHTPSEKSY